MITTWGNWGVYCSSLRARRAREINSRWGLKVIQSSDIEPVSLEDAKLHLRVDDDGGSPPAHPDDLLITGLISAAREWCEFYSGLALAPQVLEMAGRSFYPASAYCGSNGLYCDYYIELPLPPVSSIISITYTDEQNVEQTVSPTDYVFDDYSRPPRIYTAAGATWPAAKAGTPNVARIRYQAGFDTPDSSPDIYPIPQSIVAAIKLMLTHLYENRSEVEIGTKNSITQIPLGAAALLDIHRMRLGLA
jgi:uncharacterized phiE125 gp8 family phage protein